MWTTEMLSSVVNISPGNSIPAKKKSELFTGVKGMPYVATKDVSFDGIINYDNGICIPQDYLNNFRISPKYATLICAEGGSAGRKIAFSHNECCYVNKLFSLEPTNKIIPKFLYYYSISAEFQLQFNAALHGLIGGVSLTKMKKFSISYPSIPEQERIVAKLDAAFAEIDKIATNTQQMLEEAQKLYASGITDIYFSNKSVPVVPLSKIAKIKGGKRLPKGKKLQPEPTNYPYIRVSDFTDYGTIDEKSIKYITEEIHSEISRYTISSDDVYISIAGTIGKTGIIPQSLDGANLTENAAKIMLDEECDKDYFYFFTTSSSFEKQAIAQTRTTAQPKLALGRLEAVELPIHNKLSQHEIAEKARSLRDKVRLVETLLSGKLVQIQVLKSAILKQELQPSEAA